MDESTTNNVKASKENYGNAILLVRVSNRRIGGKSPVGESISVN